jgi:hypothetical protein
MYAIVCPPSTHSSFGGIIDSEVSMIEQVQDKSAHRMDAEIAIPSYEPPTLVSFGDAVRRTMGDEGPSAEKKAIAGILGSGD